MNMTLINNEISNQLDNNHIDANIYQMMKSQNHFNGKMFTGKQYADLILMENSVIHAFQQEYILYHSKYITHWLLLQKQIFFWPSEVEDGNFLTLAFKLERKKRGEYLKQVIDEPRKYIQDNIRKEEQPKKNITGEKQLKLSSIKINYKFILSCKIQKDEISYDNNLKLIL